MHIRNIITFTNSSLLAGAMLGLMLTSSGAAVVTWQAAQPISGDADVSTAGTLVGAFNVGSAGISAATVNGVLFSSFQVPSGSTVATSGNFTLDVNGSGNFLSDNSFYGSPSAPFNALSSGYKTLLESATSTSTPVTFDLIVTGLTAGQIYEFQWWVNFSGAAFPNESAIHSASGGGSAVNLSDNTTGLEGGLGQFVIGSFTADSTVQSITFAPVTPGAQTGVALLNSFQLRAVPEPSSVGLLGLAILQLGLRNRCRRQR